jgi:hypothetical protein
MRVNPRPSLSMPQAARRPRRAHLSFLHLSSQPGGLLRHKPVVEPGDTTGSRPPSPLAPRRGAGKAKTILLSLEPIPARPSGARDKVGIPFRWCRCAPPPAHFPAALRAAEHGCKKLRCARPRPAQESRPTRRLAARRLGRVRRRSVRVGVRRKDIVERRRSIAGERPDSFRRSYDVVRGPRLLRAQARRRVDCGGKRSATPLSVPASMTFKSVVVAALCRRSPKKRPVFPGRVPCYRSGASDSQKERATPTRADGRRTAPGAARRDRSPPCSSRRP